MFLYQAMKDQKKRSRAAREKLGDLPFNSISEQKEFRDKVRRKVIRQLETAKAIEEFTKHPEYRFFREKFEKGMHCRYGKDVNDIVHVYMNDNGIQVDLNENVNSEDQNQTLLVGTLVKSLSESLIASYYRAYGYIPSEIDQKDDDEFLEMLGKNLKKPGSK